MFIVRKEAISVTLEAANLVWLRARVGAGGARSVSALLDRLIVAARSQGSGHLPTSVVGTIDLSGSDPLLLGADEAIRETFRASLQRPLLVKESGVRYRAATKKARSRRG
jgi:hypothetical protein